MVWPEFILETTIERGEKNALQVTFDPVGMGFRYVKSHYQAGCLPGFDKSHASCIRHCMHQQSPTDC